MTKVRSRKNRPHRQRRTNSVHMVVGDNSTITFNTTTPCQSIQNSTVQITSNTNPQINLQTISGDKVFFNLFILTIKNDSPKVKQPNFQIYLVLQHLL